MTISENNMMPTENGPAITSVKLLLDRDFRVVSVGDAKGLLIPPPHTGQHLSDYWLGFETWLDAYQSSDPDRNNFQSCIPGAMADLTPLNDLLLLHIWKHLEVLQIGLSLLQFNALVFDANRALVYINSAAQQFLTSLGHQEWTSLLPVHWKRDFPKWLQQDTAINLERESQGTTLRWEIASDPNQHFVVMVCHPMEEREKYRRILENSVDGIYQTDAQGELIYVNHSLAKLFRYASPDDMKEHIRRVANNLYVHSEDREWFLAALAETNEVLGFECEMKRKDGDRVWVRENARSIVNEQGELTHIIGTLADISELKRSEEARKNAESDYERLFNTAQAGLFQSTISGSFIRVNHLFSRILGCVTPEECMIYYNDHNQKLYESPGYRQRLLSILERDHFIVNERTRMIRRDGTLIWVLMNSQYITDRHTGGTVLQGSVIDITEQVSAEDEIRFMAEHDILTKLPNRSQFQQQLQLAYDHWQQHNHHEFAVIFLDLDHFKDINDTLGHLVGDALLIELAQRLQQPLNASGKTYRLGGDEFAILIDGALSETDLDILCVQIGDRISREYRYQESALKVTASMGVVLCNQLDSNRSQTVIEDVMSAADLALYRCKRTGRAGYRLYEQRMRLDLQAEKTMEHELASALRANLLMMHFQPIFDARTRRIIGAEALIRWPTDAGFISPAQFIPLAERSGLIADIDVWVLRQILDHCDQLTQSYPDLIMSFNLSAHHFNNCTFSDLIQPLLPRIKRVGPQLALELTERVMFERTEGVIASLQSLRHLGVHISLDDFGTGYSSLSYLTQFPIDKIKIDQSFISNMHKNATARAVIEAAAQIGKTLHLNINAEGVETEEQLAVVQQLGIDEVQGFLLARPMPFDAFVTLLETQRQTNP
jgi:diguanylate cyclase (GGDEF)-like protein/PAS domain S-box-containing protein